MALSFRYPFKRSNDYLGTYRVRPASNAALAVLESMEFGSAVASPAVFIGSTSLTFSQTGSLKAGTSLSGTTPITFNQTGTFTAGSLAGNADFVGSIGFIFSQSGAFAAQSAVAGTSTLTFAQIGDLKAAASLAGTSTAVFGQTGSLSGGAGLNGSTALVFGQSGDFVAGAASSAAAFVGTANLTFGLSGDFTAGAGTGPVLPVQGDGDGFYPRHRGVKPIVRIRPRAERELDDVLELVESISETARVTENKTIVKSALAAIKKIEVAEIYAAPLAALEKSLVGISKHTAKHEGLRQKTEKLASEIDTLISDMEARRKRQRREEEELITWLSQTILPYL